MTINQSSTPDETTSEVESCPFNIQAVPHGSLTRFSKGIDNVHTPSPIKIKIKIQNIQDNLIGNDFISVPHLDHTKDGAKKVRLINSDQTIMSFDLLMESDLKKPLKGRNKIMKLLLPGRCLGSKTDDEKYPYIPSSSEIAEIKPSVKISQDELLSINNQLTTPKLFLGKCKPGGCLDPPFTEEKYAYRPPLQSPSMSNHKKEIVITPKKVIEKLYNESEDSKKNVQNIFEKSERQDSSETLISKTYSDVIITYPPVLSSSEHEVRKKSIEKKSKKKTNGEDEQKLRGSINEIPEVYYRPPKSNEQRSIERNSLITFENPNTLKEETSMKCLVYPSDSSAAKNVSETVKDFQYHQSRNPNDINIVNSTKGEVNKFSGEIHKEFVCNEEDNNFTSKIMKPNDNTIVNLTDDSKAASSGSQRTLESIINIAQNRLTTEMEVAQTQVTTKNPIEENENKTRKKNVFSDTGTCVDKKDKKIRNSNSQINTINNMEDVKPITLNKDVLHNKANNEEQSSDRISLITLEKEIALEEKISFKSTVYPVDNNAENRLIEKGISESSKNVQFLESRIPDNVNISDPTKQEINKYNGEINKEIVLNENLNLISAIMEPNDINSGNLLDDNEQIINSTKDEVIKFDRVKNEEFTPNDDLNNNNLGSAFITPNENTSNYLINDNKAASSGSQLTLDSMAKIALNGHTTEMGKGQNQVLTKDKTEEIANQDRKIHVFSDMGNNSDWNVKKSKDSVFKMNAIRNKDDVESLNLSKDLDDTKVVNQSSKRNSVFDFEKRKILTEKKSHEITVYAPDSDSKDIVENTSKSVKGFHYIKSKTSDNFEIINSSIDEAIKFGEAINEGCVPNDNLNNNSLVSPLIKLNDITSGNLISDSIAVSSYSSLTLDSMANIAQNIQTTNKIEMKQNQSVTEENENENKKDDVFSNINNDLDMKFEQISSSIIEINIIENIKDQKSNILHKDLDAAKIETQKLIVSEAMSEIDGTDANKIIKNEINPFLKQLSQQNMEMNNENYEKKDINKNISLNKTEAISKIHTNEENIKKNIEESLEKEILDSQKKNSDNNKIMKKSISIHTIKKPIEDVKTAKYSSDDMIKKFKKQYKHSSTPLLNTNYCKNNEKASDEFTCLSNSSKSTKNGQDDMTSNIFLNLAFQSYINNKNEKIMYTLNAFSKSQQHEKNETNNIIRTTVKIDNDLIIHIDSDIDVHVRINKSKNSQSKFLGGTADKESPRKSLPRKNNKNNEILLDSLQLLYNKNLLQVEQVIKNLRTDIIKMHSLHKKVNNKKFKFNNSFHVHKNCKCSNKRT